MYAAETTNRQQYLFPPFCFLLKLSARRASSKAAEAAADKLKTTLQKSGLKIRVEGPAPSFYEKFQGKFQWQLIIKSTERSELLKVIAGLPANWSYDIDPLDLL
jgi:primosomal protein N'